MKNLEIEDSLKRQLVKNMRFRGAASLGDRGQVAVPAELRRELGVKAGERLMVFSVEGHDAILFLTAQGLAALLQDAGADAIASAFATGNGANGDGGEDGT